jgi:hypothetical protein
MRWWHKVWCKAEFNFSNEDEKVDAAILAQVSSSNPKQNAVKT